jgi:nicotinamidase-related amidase
MAEKVLLIIDMLNDFVDEGAQLEVPDIRKTIPAVRQEIDIF